MASNDYRAKSDSVNTSIALVQRDVDELRRAIEEHDEMLGRLGAEVGTIGKDVAVIRAALEPLLERPSRVEMVRGALSSPPAARRATDGKAQLMLIGGLVAAIEIISRLVAAFVH